MNTLKTFDHVADLQKQELKLREKHAKELQDFESEKRAYYIKMIYSFLPILKQDEIFIDLPNQMMKPYKLRMNKNQRVIKLAYVGKFYGRDDYELRLYAPFTAEHFAYILNYLETELKDKTY